MQRESADSWKASDNMKPSLVPQQCCDLDHPSGHHFGQLKPVIESNNNKKIKQQNRDLMNIWTMS